MNVRIKTDKGAIVLELYPDKAPETVANFITYVKDGFYDGTIFHRVINGFMIQGGGFEPGMSQKETLA
ncbi:MAG: peptidyl-prolyl cis-trans isomerase, partial [Gammaproteobacteria bacterium]|nr:peptidyl-prolyl cis-trans isomerase [Gammaproteobacteria bacterium]